MNCANVFAGDKVLFKLHLFEKPKKLGMINEYSEEHDFLPMLLCECDLSNGIGSGCFGGVAGADSISFISITYVLVHSGHLTPLPITQMFSKLNFLKIE